MASGPAQIGTDIARSLDGIAREVKTAVREVAKAVERGCSA